MFRRFPPDVVLLFATRSLRMFAHGFLSLVLALYLVAIGLSEGSIGLLLTLALLGDTAISLAITTSADRVGRRRMLIVGGMLMALAGVVFAVTENFFFLVIAAVIGVLSPSGTEVGPFLAIEQAALAQTVRDDRRTLVFAWYNLAGSVATALGALAGGWACERFAQAGAVGADVYRPLFVAYGAVGIALAILFLFLSRSAETIRTSAQGPAAWHGLHQSRGVVVKLAALFSLDAFGGGFVVQSFMAYWFHVRFGLDEAALGQLFFGANLLAAASSLLAARLAARFGLLNTMIFTHLPSNVLLFLVPFMPTAELAIAVLLARFSISQMDVPTRQAYTLAVVAPDERAAAGGITAVARSVGASLSPSLAGMLLARPELAGVPFVLAGAIKIIYDLWLYRSMAAHRHL